MTISVSLRLITKAIATTALSAQLVEAGQRQTLVLVRPVLSAVQGLAHEPINNSINQAWFHGIVSHGDAL
jgi:hypothetical protein